MPRREHCGADKNDESNGLVHGTLRCHGARTNAGAFDPQVALLYQVFLYCQYIFTKITLF
jgi:hypothetical protein